MTADAQRRLRLRRAGLLPDLATCTDCDRQARSTRTAPLCSRCWRLSPAGREWNRLRMAAQRLTTAAGSGTLREPQIESHDDHDTCIDRSAAAAADHHSAMGHREH